MLNWRALYDPTITFPYIRQPAAILLHTLCSAPAAIAMRTLQALLLIAAALAATTLSPAAAAADYAELEEEQEFADIFAEEERQRAPCICINPFQGWKSQR